MFVTRLASVKASLFFSLKVSKFGGKDEKESTVYKMGVDLNYKVVNNFEKVIFTVRVISKLNKFLTTLFMLQTRKTKLSYIEQRR